MVFDRERARLAQLHACRQQVEGNEATTVTIDVRLRPQCVPASYFVAS